jgi:ABC-type sugar transport system ATPase subunit
VARKEQRAAYLFLPPWLMGLAAFWLTPIIASADLRVTTVYVTHDQTEAMTLGDLVAMMKNGVLQQVASPQELYSDPANLFVRGFIGSPPMNVVEARIFVDARKLYFFDPANGSAIYGDREVASIGASGGRSA